MRITVIGAGRVASSLAPALSEAGCRIVQVWSRTEASAKRLADAVGAEAVSGDFSAINPAIDIVIVAVRDAVLESVIDSLRPLVLAPIVHTAGSMPGDLADGVLYPLQTFSMERRVDFARVHCFVEAQNAMVEQKLVEICELLTKKENVHRLDSEGRRLLHLAAVFACNFTNHCCTLAGQVLETAGVKFDVLLPLVEETVAKLCELPPSVAQTGPAARHDTNVMQAQAALLDKIGEGSGNPLLAEIYRTMSESIVQTTTINNI